MPRGPITDAPPTLLRAAHGYELVPLHQLTPAEQNLVADSLTDAELFGVFRPLPNSGLWPRVAMRDVALLFLALKDPSPLPERLVRDAGRDPEKVAAALVMDGVLEVIVNGRWLSGLIDWSPARNIVGRDKIGGLSIDAVRYAQALDASTSSVAVRLYLYGGIPVVPAMRRKYGDESSVASWINLLDTDLGGRWFEQPTIGAREWRSWFSTATGDRDKGCPTWKLYVSGTPQSLGDAIRGVVSVADGMRGVFAMKCGRGLAGVTRPDRFVVYCSSLESLQTLAAGVRAELDGMPADGVPFTAPIGQDGLLSWGVDPPTRGARRQTSWRQWITERLATFLAEASFNARQGPEPWQYAIERLASDGVDTRTWTPEDGLFTRPPAS